MNNGLVKTLILFVVIFDFLFMGFVFIAPVSVKALPGETINISDSYPLNESTDSIAQPVCNITINHVDGLGLNISWYENSTGEWVLRQSNNHSIDQKWIRYGTVLNNTTEGTSSWENESVYTENFESTVIVEGSPVIFTEEESVFKMWYSAGWSHCAIGYAESIDGFNWTKYSGNPVLNSTDGIFRSHVYRINETTLWLYAVEGNETNVTLYNSTDGINWTLDTAVCLTVGENGEWDDFGIASTFIWYEGENDWRMLYEASDYWSYRIGYATSTDGRTFTKYEGNPVITLYAAGRPYVDKVGSYYYCWFHAVPDYPDYSTEGFFRYRSTDFINWEVYPSDAVFTRVGADEGSGTLWGAIADNWHLNYDDKVWLYYSAFTDAYNESGSQHIKLAIFNGTVDNLVAIEDENYTGNPIFNGTYEWTFDQATEIGETYYWMVTITDGYGNWANATYSFSTGIAPEVITYDASNVNSSDATLNGNISSNDFNLSSYGFEYGFDTNYGLFCTGEDYLYISDLSNLKIVNAGNLSLVNSTAVSNIYMLDVDDNYIYVSTQGSQVINQYWRSNLTYVNSTPAYGHNVYGIVEDGDYIYYVGATKGIKRAFKSNMSISGEVADTSTLRGIILDEDYIYVYTSNYLVKQYWKSNLTYRTVSSSFGSTILSIADDTNYIYVGGNDGYVKKYSKSDMSLVASTADLSDNRILGIYTDDEFLYVGGETSSGTEYNFYVYWLSNFTMRYMGVVPNDVNSIVVSGLGVYLGTNGYVYKYLKDDLSFISKSGASITASYMVGGDKVNNYTYDYPYNYSLAVENILPGVLYHYRAFAVNDIGVGYGEDMTFLTEPAYPYDFVATTIDSSSISLSWVVGTGADVSVIQRSTTVYPTIVSEGENVFNDTGTTFTDVDLTPGQMYYYSIWSYAENESLFEFSDNYSSAIALTKPDAPTNLVFTEGGTTFANMSWVKGDGANNTVIVRKVGGYPSDYSDGEVVYNDTGTFFNDTFIVLDMFIYRAWSFSNWTADDVTLFEYSDEYVDNSVSGAVVYVYDLSSGSLLNDWTIFISDQSGDNVYSDSDCDSPHVILNDSLPYGENTMFQITKTGYENGIIYKDFDSGSFINISLYLVTDEDNSLNTVIDSIDDFEVDKEVELDCDVTEIIAVEKFNITTFLWTYLAEDTYSLSGNTITIDSSVLDINTTMVRVSYYCVYASHYIIRVKDTSGTAIDDAKVNIKKFIEGTGNFEDIAVLLTDGNGECSVDLLSGFLYKINISCDGYITSVNDWIPPQIVYAEDAYKVFILTFEPSNYTNETNVVDCIIFYVSHNDTHGLVNFSNLGTDCGLVTNFSIWIYEINPSSNTTVYFDSYNYTGNQSASISFLMNTTNNYIVQICITHDYFGVFWDSGYIVNYVSPHATNNTEFNDYLTAIFGENSLTWSGLFGIFILLGGLFAFGQRAAGVSLILTGMVMLGISAVLGLVMLDVSVCIFIVIIGILVQWRIEKRSAA